MLESARGRPASARSLIARAVAVDPRSAAAHVDLAHALNALGAYAEAIEACAAALVIQPDVPEALGNRGVALAGLGRHHAALESYDAALALRPDLAAVLSNRGNALNALGRHAEAVASCDRALALAPALAEAWHGRGIAQSALARHAEALASFDRALAIRPEQAAVLASRSIALIALGRHDEAVAGCDRALALDAGSARALVTRGNALLALTRHAQALASFHAALALQPDRPEVLSNIGTALCAQQRHAEAMGWFDRALAIDGDLIVARTGRAQALGVFGRHAEACADLRHALALDPDCPGASGALLNASLHCCDWSEFETLRAHVVAGVRAGARVIDPFSFLSVSDCALDQRRCARIFAAERFPITHAPLWQGEHYRHERIRIAYLSANLRAHANGHLLADLIALHDRDRFEINAISFGAADGSALRARFERDFDRFVDVRDAADADVAALMRRLEIDIAVDLMGYTTHCRPGILARRPAPVQASFLGFPGTLAAGHIDYLIADRTVIPEDQQDCYHEKIVYLPDTYQCNPRTRPPAARTPSRVDMDLPPSGFVFCCFNSSHKILPAMFEIWMRLLDQVPQSVLWLLAPGSEGEGNLRGAAAGRGVDPKRVVFAPRAVMPDYLGRYPLADLFLDTQPYNAHVTASDALWAGVPVLTCLGSTFAGRVAASLLRAAGVPELITFSLAEYEALALTLATDPERLGRLRHEVAQSRQSCPLFDTDRFRRHLEASYVAMHDRCLRGLAPAAFFDRSGRDGAALARLAADRIIYNRIRLAFHL